MRPLDFADPSGLADSLRGAGTLYNTYWVRFPKGPVDHQRAVANSRTLFYAARDAGVARIVHVSITHPDASSQYSYFRGKAAVERILAGIGVPHAIVRPAVLFGGDGVLINNIAWLLRRLPVFRRRGHWRLPHPARSRRRPGQAVPGGGLSDPDVHPRRGRARAAVVLRPGLLHQRRRRQPLADDTSARRAHPTGRPGAGVAVSASSRIWFALASMATWPPDAPAARPTTRTPPGGSCSGHR